MLPNFKISLLSWNKSCLPEFSAQYTNGLTIFDKVLFYFLINFKTRVLFEQCSKDS